MKINKYLPIILKLTFLLALFGVVIAQKSKKPRVLVMHSYALDYAWVKEVNVGVQRVFDKRQDMLVRYHYMDLKNHDEENFRRTATATAIQTIENWRPDILILIDDWAQKLIGTRYVDHPSVKIVFSGVNATAETYGYDKAKNVTGILERTPLDAIRETLLMIARARGFQVTGEITKHPRLLYIADKSTTVDAKVPIFSNFKWDPIEWLPPIRIDTFQEWKDTIRRVGKENLADLIIVSDYHQLKQPDSKDPAKAKEVMEWTESNSEIPVLGTGTVNVQDGGMMMAAGSGYEQGEVAAQMAVEIGLGKNPKDLPITETKMFIVAVRKSAMDKRKLPIPSIYEAFARATNNFYE